MVEHILKYVGRYVARLAKQRRHYVYDLYINPLFTYMFLENDML